MSQNQRTAHSALATVPSKSRRWNREYLPGYTGFVPTQKSFVGKTSGQINREISLCGGSPQELDLLELNRHKEQLSDLPASKSINPDVYGYRSKESVNWVSGPTHMVRQQHVPGYTGHNRGFVTKDLMHKSYAKVTAELFSRKHPMGDDTDPKTRFTATQRAQFKPNNFRRWIHEPTLEHQRDYDDYSKYVNDNNHDKKSNLLSKTMREVPLESLTPGRQTAFTPGMLTPSSLGHGFSRYQQAQRRMTIDTSKNQVVKPKLLESKVSTQENFFQLSEGYQRVFSNDARDQKMVVPVVGYGGHRRGDQSQNYFGKSFRDSTIQSKFLERQFRNRNAAY